MGKKKMMTMDWMRFEHRIRKALEQYYRSGRGGYCLKRGTTNEEFTIDLIDFIVADETMRGSERYFNTDDAFFWSDCAVNLEKEVIDIGQKDVDTER